MKRVGKLFDKICFLENLHHTDQPARKGNLLSHGVKKHDKNKEANLINLREVLLNGTYKTSKYDVFTITEPKEREIHR